MEADSPFRFLQYLLSIKGHVYQSGNLFKTLHQLYRYKDLEIWEIQTLILFYSNKDLTNRQVHLLQIQTLDNNSATFSPAH